jgi:hypothetical protein
MLLLLLDKCCHGSKKRRLLLLSKVYLRSWVLYVAVSFNRAICPRAQPRIGSL